MLGAAEQALRSQPPRPNACRLTMPGKLTATR